MRNIKKIILVAIIMYVAYTLFSQQKMLSAYQREEAKYTKEIEQARLQQEELTTVKSNIDSVEYIEEVAREKLGMYLPNERVYMDIKK